MRPASLPLGQTLERGLSGTLIEPWNTPGPTPRALFAQLYHRHEQWVLVMACGIAVRYLAGLPADKRTDPAVVVVDEAGRHAISLLCGHEGGANELSFQVANLLGATPIVTTASEAAKPLVVGIGCRKGASRQAIEAAVKEALSGRDIQEIREIATIELKAKEPGLLEFCAQHRLPLRWFTKEELAARPFVSAPSQWVQEKVGVPGVCEPAALLASARGRLLGPRHTKQGVAVAVVEDGTRRAL